MGNQTLEPHDEALSLPFDVVHSMHRRLNARLGGQFPTPRGPAPRHTVPETAAEQHLEQHLRGGGGGGGGGASSPGAVFGPMHHAYACAGLAGAQAFVDEGQADEAAAALVPHHASARNWTLPSLCRRWRWVAVVRAEFLSLFCHLFQNWDMDMQPRLDPVR